jgi:cellulose synthase (UDP-forming)
MPNLAYFANDGFPFTRMADLSETAVVMPNKVSLAEMETYLMIMGRMGRVTGYPAIRHELISAANVEANANRDLILIGSAGNQPLLERWADKMHPLLNNGTHTLKLPGPFERLRSRWENRDLEDAMHRAGDLITKGDGGLGALVAFESPLKAGRAVVVFTGDNPEQIETLVTSMGNPKMLPSFHGDLVMQSGKRIEGFQTGPTYFTGSLPWWTALRWYLSRQPLILIVLIGAAALLVAVMAFRYLRKLASVRLGK